MLSHIVIIIINTFTLNWCKVIFVFKEYRLGFEEFTAWAVNYKTFFKLNFPCSH